MRNLLIIILVMLPNFCFSQEFKGYFVGLERMCEKDKNGKLECYGSPAKWYHLNHLYIDKDSVFLYQNPVEIKNRDTLYSASLGAFYYYAGKLSLEGTIDIVTLTMTNCDYCGRLSLVDSLTNTYTYLPVVNKYQIIKKKNKLIINKVRYSKAVDAEYPIDRKCFLFKVQENKPKKFE